MAAERLERLRNGRGSNAIPAYTAQQMEDEETIARILGQESQSIIGG